MTEALIDKAASAPRTARAVHTALAKWPEDPAPEPDTPFLESITPLITAIATANMRS